MLPSMQTTTTTTNNRCLVETERDVAHVEYDVINYYTDANVNPNLNPNADTLTAGVVSQQQRFSRVNNNNSSNNNNTLLDVVVNARSVREDSMATPTVYHHHSSNSNSSSGSGSNSSSGTSSPPMRIKSVGNNNRRRSTAKESCTAASSTPTLGVNMRVTGQCSQGGRKYMEDQFSVAYQESPLTHELEYAFFGIYDGHGGTEAALFAKEHLMLEIVKQKLFWSDNDEDVLRAIREGFIGTHFAMWREQEKWPRTANGHLSTAGTTATVAFMRREKIYIGHVGDSGIVLGYQNPHERRWRAKQLTTDHKPESLAEKARIQRSGGQVAIKSGVPRVVWNRPRDPMHRGPIRRRTIVDDIPFLAVARSLGDLWSYNSRCKEFVVSPDPDVKVVKIDPKTFRCLIFGTDGLWNVVTPQEAVDSVREKHFIGECLHEQDVMNPSKALVERALKTWATKKMRADNTSVVTVILTPAAGAATTATATTNGNMDMLLDTENNYPEHEELEEEEQDDLDLDLELCAHIEEQEYRHDTPYSALAKRHLPPEPYRNFDYYIEEEQQQQQQQQHPLLQHHHHHHLQHHLQQQQQLLHQNDVDDEEEEEEEDEEVDDDDDDVDEDMEQELQHEEHIILQQSHHLLKSLQQSIDALMDVTVDAGEEDDDDDDNDNDNDDDEEESIVDVESADLYSNNLEHNYVGCYGNSASAVAASTEYSFAESYNTLLNEQQQQQQQQQHSHHQRHQLQQHQQQQQQHQQPEKEEQHMNGVHSMQEILQEQQRYQQQEGYSLTQLETRREQQQQQQQQQQSTNSNRWQQEQQPSPTYVEQPAELLALNALLQQERDEEQQVALEREQKQQQQQQQQEQQLLLVEASSSSSSSSSCSSTSSSSQSQFNYAASASWNDNNVATLQDNEVSSTLPATPTSTPTSTPSSSSSSSEDSQTMEPQQQPQTLPQQQQPLPMSHPPRIRRQMRRYRNVPNENHQHMQTRRRQMFKHSRGKSFSAAAFVAYSNSNTSSSSNNNNSSSSEILPSTSSSSNANNNNSVTSNNNNNNNNRRRRSVNVNAAANSSSVMMTRRSHSLSLASGSGVIKRQLRSSICQLGNLDMTKRTLRTRNVTPAATNSSSSSTNNNNSNNNANRNTSSHTFNKPAAPAAVAAASAASTPSSTTTTVRRLRRSNEEREQRRSLRRSTLSAAGHQLSSGSGANSPFSKPTRLQSCSGGIAARPPPSPKKLNAVVPTLAIGTRAYTAALAAAAADISKRWSLRSSSSNNNGTSDNANAMATLVTAISCYSSSARSRTAAAAAPTSRRR